MSLPKITPDELRVAGKPALGKMPKRAAIDDHAFERRLKALQHDLARIQQAYLHTGDRAVVVLEGWDAAGKGGVVRRLGWALDPRSFRVYPIGAPTEAEKAQHYLQRFWTRLPSRSQIVVFDRSWYGRVLVERVEGFAARAAWERAYDEINNFEKDLVADGARVAKIFLDITAEEQAARFRDRLTDPLKRWKLTYEDFRNRARWDDYRKATADMMSRTSTPAAPWHLVPSNDKSFSRLAIFEILIEVLGRNVPREPAPVAPQVAAEAERLFGKQ